MRFPGHAALAIGMVLAIGHEVAAQRSSAASSLGLYHRARDIVLAAAEAAGGANRLSAMESVRFRRRGFWYLRNQGAKPGAAGSDSVPTDDATWLDLTPGSVVLDSRTGARGIRRMDTRVFIQGERRVAIDRESRTVQPDNTLGLPGPLPLHLRFPPLIIRRALERPESLRWIGRHRDGDRDVDVVSFAWDGNTTLHLGFDAATRMLTRAERLYPDYEYGDAESTDRYGDYTEVDGVMVPGTYEQWNAGTKVFRFAIEDVAIDAGVPDSLFAVPVSYQPFVPATFRLAPIGDGAYLIEAQGMGYNGLLVEFADHLLVMEAPGTPWVRQALDLARAVAPSKPVRFAALSHFHFDHVAGIGALVDVGASIVTTASNRAFLERVVSALPTLRAIPQGRRNRSPRFEVVPTAGRRTFTDGTQRVDLIDVGPTPHVDELLVAYLPNQRALFVADAVPVPWASSRLIGPSPSAAHLVRRIRELRLDVASVFTVHGRSIGFEELVRLQGRQR